MRKPAFCIYENKDADQFRGYREADQRLCFRYTEAYTKTKTQINFAVTAKLISAFVFATRKVQSLYFLYTKCQASSHLVWLYGLVCVLVWSETPKTDFLTTRFNILCVAIKSGTQQKSFQSCPWGLNWSSPGVIISHRLTIGKRKIGSQLSNRCPLGYLFLHFSMTPMKI